MVWLIYILVFGAFLVPPWRQMTALPSLRIEDPILLFLFFWLLLSGRKSFGELVVPRHFNRLSIPLLCMICYVGALTLMCIPVAPSYEIPFRLVNVVKRLKPLLQGVVLFALLSRRKDLRALANATLILVIVEVILMYMQSHDYFGVNSWLSPMFRGEDLKGQHRVGERVFGSFANVNTMGTLLSVMGTISYARTLFGQGKGRILSGIAVVLCLYGTVWLARTRQGTGCLIVGILTVQLLSMISSGRRGWGLVGMIFIAVTLVVAMGYLVADPKLSDRFAIFTGERGITEENSMAARLAVWPSMLAQKGGILMVGRGITLEFGWDSGLFNTLDAGGIPCVVGLILLYLLPGLHSRKCYKETGIKSPFAWNHVAGWAITFPLLLTTIVNTTWSEPKTMTTIVTLYVLTLGAGKVEDIEHSAVLHDDLLESHWNCPDINWGYSPPALQKS